MDDDLEQRPMDIAPVVDGEDDASDELEQRPMGQRPMLQRPVGGGPGGQREFLDEGLEEKVAPLKTRYVGRKLLPAARFADYKGDVPATSYADLPAHAHIATPSSRGIKKFSAGTTFFHVDDDDVCVDVSQGWWLSNTVPAHG